MPNLTKRKKRYMKGDLVMNHLPIVHTAVVWLVLDRLKPSGTVVGIVWTLWGLWFLLNLVTKLYYAFGRTGSTPVWDEEAE